MSTAAIEVDALEYRYPDGTAALGGVTFRIADGESVAVVGANGAGKSTLLMHVNGALAPQRGRVRIAGVEVSARSLPAVRRTVGAVFQDPDDQLFMPTVGDDVAFGPANLGLAAAEVDRRVGAALDRVGLARLRARPPYRLSGGEKRAIAIATVLAMEPAILALDEPSASLDPGARRRMIDLLGGLGHTRVVATHDLDLALALCPRTIALCGGLVAADGATRDVLTDSALLGACSLEPPAALRPCARCGAMAAVGR